MKAKLLVIAGLLSVNAIFAVADECEPAVDMADSLNFHKMHIECADDPTFTYDVGDNDASDKNSEGVMTYTKTGSRAGQVEQEGLDRNALGGVQVQTLGQDNAGKLINLREPFSLTGGPDSAIRGLFAQMARYCPAGWTKSAEWVEPAQAGYFLHYQIRCAE